MSSGLSRERLARLTGAMTGYVERGEVPGVQTLVWRGGELVHRDLIGKIAFNGAEVQPDTLYRLSSLTKPIVSVLALTFVEEGRLRLSDRVDRWLPELSALKVLLDPLGPLDQTRSAPRPITVADLLTHRAGFATAWLPQGPIGRAIQALVGGDAPRADLDADTWLRRLAELPLIYPPGERLVMGFCSDVLGILLSRLSGVGLDQLLQGRIFEPLNMSDTVFWASGDRISRLGVAYSAGWLSGRLTVSDPQDGYWSQPPSLLSGGGGLISTADDYLRFGRMLLDNGRLDGRRILSRKTVELMTQNFLSPDQRADLYFGFDYWSDRGLGLGVFVTDRLAPRGAPASIGQYGWRARFGNYWFNDPAEDLVAILMISVRWSTVLPPISSDFEALVYQAIDD